jgi:hypothetical protein
VQLPDEGSGSLPHRVVGREHAPGEARRLLRDMPFTAEQRRHIEGPLDAWEEGR